MKVIFLDIDGVLNSKFSKSNIGNYIGIDTAKVKQLRRIVEETGARIVLSSDWKEHYRIARSYEGEDLYGDYLIRKLRRGGVHIYSITPDIKREDRGREIFNWLSRYDEDDIESYVILDDEVFNFNAYGLGSRHIKTEWAPQSSNEAGLTPEKADAAIKLLNEL